MSTQQQSGISRRTLTKGAAWSVPAVALAGAAPALAASCVPVTITASCAPVSLGNPVVSYTITSTNGQPIPAGSTFVASVTGIALTGIKYGGTLYSSSTRSGDMKALTMTTTTAAPSYTFTMKPGDACISIGIAYLSLCATGGGVCSGTCCTRKIKYKTLGGIGAGICI